MKKKSARVEELADAAVAAGRDLTAAVIRDGLEADVTVARRARRAADTAIEAGATRADFDAAHARARQRR